MSGVALKDSGEEKTSQWEELQAVHLVIHFVWKKFHEAKILIYLGHWSGYPALAWKDKGLEHRGTAVCGRAM